MTRDALDYDDYSPERERDDALYFESLPYNPIAAAAEADNEVHGHARSCAYGAGGDCTCGRSPVDSYEYEEDAPPQGYTEPNMVEPATLADDDIPF